MLMSIVRTAYRFIRFDRAKSIGVMVGIVISTFLIGQQLGIAFFLSGLMSAVVDNSSGDIWVIDTRAKDANQVGFIDSRNTRLVQSIPGVAIAYPIVITGGKAVLAAGQASFDPGASGHTVAWMNNHSGHFFPDAASLDHGVDAFNKAGIHVPAGAAKPYDWDF